MSKRKTIPKKTRFEVFKRDKFTCQYCGAKAPDVVLHVDHITPVAEGGDNDIMNLVTACEDCNLGKGARELSDDSAIAVRRKQAEELAERREQIEMMRDWQMSQLDEVDEMTNAADDLIKAITGYNVNERGLSILRTHIKKFGYKQVLEAISTAFECYGYETDEEWERSFAKIGGICFNRVHKTCKQCVNFAAQAALKYEVYCSIDDGVHNNREADKCPNFASRFEKQG